MVQFIGWKQNGNNKAIGTSLGGLNYEDYPLPIKIGLFSVRSR